MAKETAYAKGSIVLDDPITNEHNRHQYGGRLRLAQEIGQAIDAGDFSKKQEKGS